MDEWQPTNVAKMQFMQWAIVRDKHDPDDTLQLAVTHKELALLISGLVLSEMILPEFSSVKAGLMDKFEELTTFQNFFSTRIPEGWEGPPTIDLENEDDDTEDVE